tara:strand:- start:4335 stop:4574 length:240 start_codon:yes stop_codon:yes gene_type:complete
MKTVYEYKLIKDTAECRQIEKDVQIHMMEGWKPSGGIAFNNGIAYQALVRARQVDDRKKSEKKILTANQAFKAMDRGDI